MADPDKGGPQNDTVDGAPPAGGAPSRIFRGTVTGLNTLGSLWIFALMLLINADAFGRTFLNAPIEGAIEITEMSIVAIVFLQLADALRTGKLTRSDGLFNMALNRFPKFGQAMGITFDLLGAVFMAIVVYGSIPLLYESYTRGYFVGEIGMFNFPTWPIKLVIVIGTLVALLQFLIFARRYLRGPHRVEDEPPTTVGD